MTINGSEQTSLLIKRATKAVRDNNHVSNMGRTISGKFLMDMQGLAGKCLNVCETILPSLQGEFGEEDVEIIIVGCHMPPAKLCNHAYIKINDGQGNHIIVDPTVHNLHTGMRPFFAGTLDQLQDQLAEAMESDPYKTRANPSIQSIGVVDLAKSSIQEKECYAGRIIDEMYDPKSYIIRAVKNGNIKEFDKLINSVDINHQDRLGNTALHYAVMRPSHQNIKKGSEDNRILMLEKLLGHDKLNTNLKNLNNNGFKEIIKKKSKE
jgi:hypothetical protein